MRSTPILPFLVFLSACSASSTDKDTSTPLDSGSSDASVDTTTDGAREDTTGLVTDSELDASDSIDPPKTEAAVYGHSAKTLYRLDPITLDLTTIGDFVGADGDMTDIALDKDAVMYGVTFTGLFRIDYKPGPPKCTKLAGLSTLFNGLTVVPKGMIDADKEVIVGIANDGGWWRVDPSAGTAKVTQLGSYGGGWNSSGDSVGIIGDAVYSTVTNDVFGLAPDHVVTVNPKTGAILKDLGSTGVPGFYGVGYWGGVMYGFAKSGSLYKIDLKTAKATEIPLKTKPAGGWWGAGVTTNAPTIIK